MLRDKGHGYVDHGPRKAMPHAPQPVRFGDGMIAKPRPRPMP